MTTNTAACHHPDPTAGAPSALVRRVTARGVRFANAYYIRAALAPFIGETISVVPSEDATTVDVYRDGSRLCTARRVDLLTPDDINELTATQARRARYALYPLPHTAGRWGW